MKETIKIGGMTVPANLTQKELIKFIVANKALLMAEKKQELKKADAVSLDCDFTTKFFIDKDGKLNKGVLEKAAIVDGVENVIVVINTTNWMDSHLDVHIPGLWKKSLSDNKAQLHLQEHEMAFQAVISDEAKGYTEKMSWKELGLEIAGTTEALIFASPLKGRNPYMEEQYRKKFVKNHSVGMRYVTIKLCVNEPDDEYYKEEYANWVQYAPMIANIVDAEAVGFFWAVLEAKIIEGSAVVKGSNIHTPTLGFKSAQPDDSTEHKQPDDSTVVKDENTEVRWEKIATLFN